MRYVWFWLTFLFSVVIPLAIIHHYYPLFYSNGAWKPSGFGIIAAVGIIWYFKDHFKTFVILMEASILKAFLIMLLRAFPYIILAMLVIFLQDQLDRVQMILWTIGGSEFISGYFKYRHLEIIQPKMKEKGINVTI